MTIQWRVREFAEAQGMNISILAEKAGIAYDTALDVWHGRQRRVDITMLAKLCIALKRRPGELLVFVGDLDEVGDSSDTETNRKAA